MTIPRSGIDRVLPIFNTATRESNNDILDVNRNTQPLRSKGMRALKKVLPVFRKISPNQSIPKTSSSLNSTPLSTPERKPNNRKNDLNTSSKSEIFVSGQEAFCQRRYNPPILTQVKVCDKCSTNENMKNEDDDVTLPYSPSPVQHKAIVDVNKCNEVLSIPHSPELTIPPSIKKETLNTKSEFAGVQDSSILLRLNQKSPHIHCDPGDNLNLEDEESFSFGGSSTTSSTASLPPVSLVTFPKNFVLHPSSSFFKETYLYGPPPRVHEWDDSTIDTVLPEDESKQNMRIPKAGRKNGFASSPSNSVVITSMMKRRALARLAASQRQKAAKRSNPKTRNDPQSLKEAKSSKFVPQQLQDESQERRIVKWHVVRSG